MLMIEYIKIIIYLPTRQFGQWTPMSTSQEIPILNYLQLDYRHEGNFTHAQKTNLKSNCHLMLWSWSCILLMLFCMQLCSILQSITLDWESIQKCCCCLLFCIQKEVTFLTKSGENRRARLWLTEIVKSSLLINEASHVAVMYSDIVFCI